MPLQGGPGLCAVHYLSQEYKKLLDFALFTLPTVCGLSSTTYKHLPLLSRLQHKGQRFDGTADNSVSHSKQVAGERTTEGLGIRSPVAHRRLG